MPEQLSIPQLAGVAVITLAAAVWVTVLTRILRRRRLRATVLRSGPPGLPGLPALPQQRPRAPEQESVELTPAERDAFAGLVRRFGGGR